MAAPLTSMIKRNSFHWSDEELASFTELKKNTCCCPSIAIAEFWWNIYCGVWCFWWRYWGCSSIKQPSYCFFSRQLAERHHKLAAYERELIGLAKALQHWRPYLWGRAFLIYTDHYSLNYLLEQRITTSPPNNTGLRNLWALIFVCNTVLTIWTRLLMPCLDAQ